MANTRVLQPIKERGWRRGLGNLLRAELHSWWGTRTWWTQAAIWIAVIDGITLMTYLGTQEAGVAPGMQESLELSMMLYSVFTGMFATVGVVILMQDAVVGEKTSGTAAWVLSKPVSRSAFILSKLFGNLLGVLVSYLFLPGIGAYLIISLLVRKSWLPLDGFLMGLGVLGLVHLLFMTLTLMLGTLFDSRAPVIGIPLAYLFSQQFIAGLHPIVQQIIPMTIFIPSQDGQVSIAIALMLGNSSFSWVPVISTAVFIPIFVVVALWRFSREEF